MFAKWINEPNMRHLHSRNLSCEVGIVYLLLSIRARIDYLVLIPFSLNLWIKSFSPGTLLQGRWWLHHSSILVMDKVCFPLQTEKLSIWLDISLLCSWVLRIRHLRTQKSGTPVYCHLQSSKLALPREMHITHSATSKLTLWQLCWLKIKFNWVRIID